MEQGGTKSSLTRNSKSTLASLARLQQTFSDQPHPYKLLRRLTLDHQSTDNTGILHSKIHVLMKGTFEAVNDHTERASQSLEQHNQIDPVFVFLYQTKTTLVRSDSSGVFLLMTINHVILQYDFLCLLYTCERCYCVQFYRKGFLIGLPIEHTFSCSASELRYRNSCSSCSRPHSLLASGAH